MRARRPEGAARGGILDRVHAALGRLFQVRPGEKERLALSFAHIFLVVATISLLKPLRNALFIESFGVKGLPWAFMGVAGASALFIWAYARLSGRAGTRALILSGLAIGSAGLLAFWAVLAAGSREDGPSAAVAAFYILGAVFSVISASQVWLLANLAFDAREARRLFGILAAGGISGGIAGGYLASYLASRWGGLSILPVGAILLGAAACAANALWIRAGTLAGRAPPGPAASDFSLVRGERLRDLWGAVLGSPHASALALMVGIATVAGSLAEFQFSSLAAASISDGDSLTAFLGFWLSNLSVFSLIFQLALSNRLLRNRGIRASLLFLPLAVAGGSLAVLAWPALWSGVLLKAGDGALKNSLNKSATELLYMPLPGRGREKAKMFIDVFVDNLATGLAGMLLLLLTLAPGSDSPRFVSLLLLALVAAWIPALYNVHREYVNSLRQGMEKRSLSLSREAVHAGEAALLGSLAAALRSGNPRQILYALDWLESVREGTEKHLPEFRALLGHEDPDLRLRVLQLLRRLAYPGFGEECRALAKSAAGSAERLAALRYLLRIGQDPVSSVFPYLMGEDMRLKEAAINALCLEARRQPALAAKVDWTALLEGFEAHASSTAGPSGASGTADPARPADGARPQDGSRKLRIIKARIIGVSGLEARVPELLELLADPDIEVRKSALSAAGDARWAPLAPDLLPHLLALPTRVPAREAIAAQGEGAVAPLRAALREAALPPALLRFLPEILGMMGTQSAVAGLMENLDAADQSLRFECIKALNKARKAAPRLRLPHDVLESALLRELKGHFHLNALYCRTDPSLLTASDAPLFRRELELLRAALRERLQRALERIFRLLSLRFDARDFHRAYQNLMGGTPFLRANAVELMDNLLPAAWKKLLLPLVESESPLGLAAHSRGLIPVDAPAWPDCLARLVETQDDWIKTLALHILGRSREIRFLPLAREFSDSRDSRVRDAARRAAAAMESAAMRAGTVIPVNPAHQIASGKNA